jgi:hypothetical protein
MWRRNMLICLAFLLVLVTGACAEILVWDNDNWKMFADPEGGGYVGCEYAIVKALEANGQPPIVQTYLPASLEGYEAVFIVLGWC